MGTGDKSMQVLNMDDPVTEERQFLKFLAGDEAVDTFDEVGAEVEVHEVEEVAEADHAGDLVLGEIEGCEIGEGAEMGDVGKSVDGVVEFLKACALSNVELYFFEKVHGEVDGEQLGEIG